MPLPVLALFPPFLWLLCRLPAPVVWIYMDFAVIPQLTAKQARARALRFGVPVIMLPIC